MDVVTWCDGELVAVVQPLVRGDDRAVTSGLGIYETLVVLDGEVFAIDRHLERLRHSAQIMGLPTPAETQLREALALVARTGGWNFGRIRITVTAGPNEANVGRTILMGSAATEVTQIRAATVRWVRNERSATAGAKCISVADNVLAARAAKAGGAEEAILGNTRDELCEGSTSNLLVVQNGMVFTPPLESGCLNGVTRQLLLRWGQEWGIPVVERTLPLTVLDDVRSHRAALAITSTTRTVVPVVELDGVRTANSDLFAELRKRFVAQRQINLNP